MNIMFSMRLKCDYQTYLSEWNEMLPKELQWSFIEVTGGPHPDGNMTKLGLPDDFVKFLRAKKFLFETF